MATTKTTATKASTARSTSTTPKATTRTSATADGQRFDLREVDVRTLVTDSAYATVGAGDLAVETARTLPKRLEEQRKLLEEAPARAQAFVKETPAKLQTEWTHGYETARKEFDTYAARGRKVVDSIARAPQTKRALEQTDTARSQVKGALTSIRKAVEQGQQAVEGAVKRIGQRRAS